MNIVAPGLSGWSGFSQQLREADQGTAGGDRLQAFMKMLHEIPVIYQSSEKRAQAQQRTWVRAVLRCQPRQQVSLGMLMHDRALLIIVTPQPGYPGCESEGQEAAGLSRRQAVREGFHQ